MPLVRWTEQEAIQAGKDLPADKRQRLPRSLDKHERPSFVVPWREDWGRKLFDLPASGRLTRASERRCRPTTPGGRLGGGLRSG